jgi:hypothetical protein
MSGGQTRMSNTLPAFFFDRALIDFPTRVELKFLVKSKIWAARKHEELQGYRHLPVLR